MKPISEYLKENYLICDGAFGTYYAEKYNTKELPELANLSAPERVREIHEEYVSAGAKLIRTNTFAAHPDLLNCGQGLLAENVKVHAVLQKKPQTERHMWRVTSDRYRQKLHLIRKPPKNTIFS